MLELLPLVGEANAISEELDKHKYGLLSLKFPDVQIFFHYFTILCYRNFELVLISGAAQGNLSGSTKYVLDRTATCVDIF